VRVGLPVAGVVIALLGGSASVGDAASQPEVGGSALDRERSLRGRIGAIVESERRRGFSGVVLVAPSGRPVFSRGVGLADRRRRTPITARTVFDIGSVTKPLILAAALALVEDGRLELSDRLGDLLPGVPDDKRAITVRQLLAHRAGLAEYVVDSPGGDFAPLSRDEALQGDGARDRDLSLETRSERLQLDLPRCLLPRTNRSIPADASAASATRLASASSRR
jgi:CubicO group peptidase (beta-lactamase class C family)